MSFTDWLAKTLRLASRTCRLAPRPASKRRARSCQRTFAPTLEGLEDRCVLSSLDSLYIGNGIDKTVMKFDLDTGQQVPFVSSGSGGLIGPRGMIFDENHDLLVANQTNGSQGTPGAIGNVLRFDGQTGAFLNTAVASTLVPSTGAHIPFDPRGIVEGPKVAGDDTVFVGDVGDQGNFFRTGQAGRVSQFDETTGAWLRDLVPPASGPNATLFPFNTTNGPRGLVIGPDGNLYVSVRTSLGLGGAVMRFDPVSGAFLGDFVTDVYDPTTNPRPLLNRPEGLVFGPDGNLYITSFRTNSSDTDKILEFNGTTGKYISKVDEDQVGQPRAYAQAVLFGPNGKLFAPIANDSPDYTSPYTGEVRRYDVSPGAFTGTGTFDTFIPPISQTHAGPGAATIYLTFGNTDPATLAYRTPSLTVDKTSLGLGTSTYGTAGTTATYSISGNALTDNVLITAPAGVELSPDGTTWSGSLTLTPTTPTLAGTTIDVRISAAAYAGNLGGVIQVTSAGAKELDVSLSGAINPATLTITPDANQSKTYGDAVPTLTYTASGFVNNEPSTTLAGSLGTTATSGSSVGNYAFTTDALTAGPNYTVVLAATAPTFAVTPATPTVQVTDAGGTYNQSPFAATATVAGVDQVAGPSLENIAPTLTYYVGKTANGTSLGAAPFLPGTYTVVAAFAGSPDYTSASATTTFTITTPTSSIRAPAVGVPGQPLTYSLAVNGPTQGIAFNIDYGDGTSLMTSPGGPTIKLDHIYTVPGSFTILVTATDKHGVVSQQATQSVKISTVAMEPDPSGGTALAVGGNIAGGDAISVSATDTTGSVLDVTINKTDYGTFKVTGHVFVYGQGGKDKIMLKPYVVGNNTYYYIQVPAFLYGEGSGGDKISALGSAANNVLSGNGANEVLTGGQGRDLLIGGTGAATLNAGVQDDLLVGGWTNYDIGSPGMTYDQKLASLNAIMAEWGSTDSYATRLSALAGYLNASTVHDNYQNGAAVMDQLLGNAKANDWFLPQ